MIKTINKIPIPIAGLMLSLAALGNLMSSYGSIYKNIFGSISGLILLLLLINFVTNTKNVTKSLDNVVVLSVAPTFSMALMILSTYIKSLSNTFSYGLWIVGIIIHGTLILYFTKKFILNFNIRKVFPSYFVVFVGIVVASVTAPVFNAIHLGQILFWFGFISYLILLPIVIYRVLIIKSIPEPALPTITIFAAPASLCLAGYMSTFQDKSLFMVWLLTVLSLIMLCGVLLYMPKMLKIKFYPSYSAFTFPLVISAIAIKKTNTFLISINKGTLLFKYIVLFEELLAVIVVLYVFIRYIYFIFNDNNIKNNIPVIKCDK